MFQAKLIIKILVFSILLTVISYISINKSLDTRYDYNIQYMYMPTMNSSSIQKLMIQSSEFTFKQDFVSFTKELDNVIRIEPHCNNILKGDKNKNIISTMIDNTLKIQIISKDKDLIKSCSSLIKEKISIYEYQLKDILFQSLIKPTNIDLIVNLKRTGNLDVEAMDANNKISILKKTVQIDTGLKKKILEEFGDQNLGLSDADMIKKTLSYYALREMLATEEIPEENYIFFIKEYELIKFFDLISERTDAMEVNKKIIFLNIFIFFSIIGLIFFKGKFFLIYYKKIIKLI
jgi:hypothetical protein